MVITFESVDVIPKCDFKLLSNEFIPVVSLIIKGTVGSNFLVCRGHPLVTIEMKVTDQYPPLELLIILCKVVLTVESCRGGPEL